MAKNGVEGVYDKDPKKYDDAVLFENLTTHDILEKNLKVMDQTAATLCKDNKMDIIVFNMNVDGNILKAAKGEKIGTLIKD
jgi:uridylate kinase